MRLGEFPDTPDHHGWIGRKKAVRKENVKLMII